MELPDKNTAEIIQTLVTSAGIVLGGVWVFWTWSLSEFLRRRKEIPSFDGEISARGITLDQTKEAVTVCCKWRNCGSVPLNVNTQATRITVYRIPEGAALGPIGPRLNNVPEIFARRPWEHWPSAILEPATTSEIQAHFLLERGSAYVFACRLEAKSKDGADKQVWVRELIWTSVTQGITSVKSNNTMEPTCEIVQG